MERVRYRGICDNGIVAATPYEMRHTFVSVNKDMPEGLKKMVIGHSKDMDTEGTYGHEMQGDMERAAEYIDAAFDRLLSGLKSGFLAPKSKQKRLDFI